MMRAALAFQMHSGWGIVVAVSGSHDSLEIVDRRRIEVIDSKVPGASQPFHYAALQLEKFGIVGAERHVAECAAVSERLAVTAFKEIQDSLHGRGYSIVGSAVLLAGGRSVPSLEKILASHPLIHTAEGEFFRNAVRNACEAMKIATTGIRERDLEEQAKAVFGRNAAKVQSRIATLGSSIGPPWTKDHKNAALAAAIVLASCLVG